MSEDKLAPCPFCGAGENRIDESNFWTGQSNKLISVTVMHWCEQEEGNLQSIIKIKRKTEKEAINAWNKRS